MTIFLIVALHRFKIPRILSHFFPSRKHLGIRGRLIYLAAGPFLVGSSHERGFVMGGEPSIYLRALVGMALIFGVSPRAMAIVLQTIDASVNVVQLDNSAAGNNDAVSLVDSSGAVTVSASGTAIFGPQPGERYNSLPVQYRDSANRLQYGVVPTNGSKLLSGNHFDFGFLTDLVGGLGDNSGAMGVTQQNSSSAIIASGIIFPGSTTPAQTGVAQISPLPSGNAAFFNVGTNQYLVTATGSATYDALGDEYGSVVVQYRDAGNGITYDTLPIGTSKTYSGFNFRIFITDFAGQTSDNTGSITVGLTPVPEPASGLLAGIVAATIGIRAWRRTLANSSLAEVHVIVE